MSSITLPEDTRQELVNSLKHYFLDDRDEEIGDLQAGLLLDFILEEIGPSIYNKAVKDAQASLQRTVAELDATLYKAEFGHSAARRRRRNR